MPAIWKVNSIIGLFFSALSVVLLIQEGLEVGVVAPLHRLLDYYKAALDFLLSWADPFVARFVETIKSLVLVNLQFNPWWKYLFVPMWLYFCAAAVTTLSAQRSIPYAIFDATIGAVIALASSATASTMPINTASSIPVFIVALGFVVFGFAEITWHSLFHTPSNQNRWTKLLRFSAAYPLGNAVAAAAVVALSAKSADLGYIIPAVAQLLCIVILMAFRNILAAFYGATFERQPGARWLQSLLAYGTFIHGFRVLIVIFGAILFIILGARRPVAHGPIQ